MLKDLKLSQEAANAVSAPTELGKHATEIYETFISEGGKGMDFSAILPYLEKNSFIFELKRHSIKKNRNKK